MMPTKTTRSLSKCWHKHALTEFEEWYPRPTPVGQEAFDAWAGPLASEARLAGEMVEKCVSLCLEVQTELKVAEESLGTTVEGLDAQGSMKAKDDNTPVTALDFGLQGYVSQKLSEEFAGDAFMGEEDATELWDDNELLWKAYFYADQCDGARPDEFVKAVDRGVRTPAPNQRVWILDPIDGTKGLITGQQYVVGLALVDSNGVPLVAAMGNPAGAPTQGVLLAVKDRGIRFWDGSQLTTNEQTFQWQAKNFDYSKLAMPVKGAWGDQGATVARTPGIDYPPYLLSRPMDSGSPLPFGPMAPPSEICCGALVKYWAVAVGAVAGFIQYQSELKAWDHASGILCVQESGGTATDAGGNNLLFPDRTIACDTAVICCAAQADQRARQLLLDSVKSQRY